MSKPKLEVVKGGKKKGGGKRPPKTCSVCRLLGPMDSHPTPCKAHKVPFCMVLACNPHPVFDDYSALAARHDARVNNLKAHVERWKAQHAKGQAALPAIEPALQHRGRPTKLTPLIVDRLVDALRKGHAHAVAARLAGVGPTTFQTWLAQGQVTPANPNPAPAFRDFRDRIKSAEAEAEDRLLGIVLAAAPTSWQAAMTILERRWPARWRRTEGVTPTDDAGRGMPSWEWAQNVIRALRTNNDAPADLPEDTPVDD